ncbi:MAG: class I SAM-dependent methyltransferase [Acidimicrobiia bacterium]
MIAAGAPMLVVESAAGAGPLPAPRWLGALTAADESVLARVEPPVLDVGCGPGRHVLALAERGIVALGIDVTAGALGLARRRGAPVIERSVFDRVPGTGRWASALLLDGNIGIGGDPVALLTRVAALLQPGGRVLAELDPLDRESALDVVRLHVDGVAGPWFAWARLGASDIGPVAVRSGLVVMERWREGERWFALLGRRDVPWAASTS